MARTPRRVTPLATARRDASTRFASTLRQEAFCRHQTIADLYYHAGRIERDVQILSHDIDVAGVDLTLIYDATIVPLQLKSRAYGRSTDHWPVRRRIPFPLTFSTLHDKLFEGGDPSNEGLGGALVVQELVPLARHPHARIWYRVGQLHLIYLRDKGRYYDVVAACQNCPATITFRQDDLTPPLTIGELLGLLLGLDSRSEIIPDISGLDTRFISSSGERDARPLLNEIETKARKRWIKWEQQYLGKREKTG